MKKEIVLENLEEEFNFKNKSRENNIKKNLEKINNFSKIEKIDDSENIDCSITNILQKFEFEEDIVNNVNITEVKKKDNINRNIRESHETKNVNYLIKKPNEKIEEKKKLIDLRINQVKLDIYVGDTADSIAKRYFDYSKQNFGQFHLNRLKKIITISLNKEIDLFTKKKNTPEKSPVSYKSNPPLDNQKQNKNSYGDIKNSKIKKNEQFYQKLKNSDIEKKKTEEGTTDDLLDSFYRQLDRNKDYDIEKDLQKDQNQKQNDIKKENNLQKKSNMLESYIDDIFKFPKKNEYNDNKSKILNKKKIEKKVDNYNSYKEFGVDILKKQKEPPIEKIEKKPIIFEKNNDKKKVEMEEKQEKVENEQKKEGVKEKKNFDVKITLDDNPYELALQIINNNNVGFNHFEKIVERIKVFQNKMKKKSKK